MFDASAGVKGGRAPLCCCLLHLPPVVCAFNFDARRGSVILSFFCVLVEVARFLISTGYKLTRGCLLPEKEQSSQLYRWTVPGYEVEERVERSAVKWKCVVLPSCSCFATFVDPQGNSRRWLKPSLGTPMYADRFEGCRKSLFVIIFAGGYFGVRRCDILQVDMCVFKRPRRCNTEAFAAKGQDFTELLSWSDIVRLETWPRAS